MSDPSRILHLDFPTPYLASATMARFQEHYDSPRFRGRAFTWEQFMDSYAADHGEFSYLTDWTGFNVPSRAFRAFRDGGFDPLTRKECALLELLRDVPEPYYVIATSKGNLQMLAHETVHGLFDDNEAYRSEVEALLAGASVSNEEAMARTNFDLLLRGADYCEEVLVDECNAYAVTCLPTILSTETQAHLARLQSELRGLFQRHFGIDLSDEANHGQVARYVTKVPYEEFARRLR